MKVTPETRRQHYIIPLIYLAFQYFRAYLMKVTPETRRQHYIIPLIYLAFQYFGIERT